jgi:hypothetical protein
MTDSLLSIALNSLFWAGIWLTLGRPPHREFIDQVLETLVAGFVVIVLALEALGLFGAIYGPAISAVCVGTALVGLPAWRRRKSTGVSAIADARREAAARITWRQAPSWIAVSLAAWAALHYLLVGLVLPVQVTSDAPIYHLSFAARWWQSGSLDFVPAPFGDAAATYFPANGELWLTWLLVAGADGTLVKVGQWPFVLVSATALYGLARDAGVRPDAAVFPAVLWVGLPLVLSQSSLANVDLIWTAFYLAAVTLLFRWLGARAADARRRLLFFALACGIVAGSKAVGAVFVMLLIVPAIAIIARHRRPMDLVVLAVGVCVPSGFWYVRNLAATGNPLYPLEIALFGHVLAEGWYRSSAMTASAYHIPVTEWRVLLDRLLLVAGPVGLAGLVAGSAVGFAHAWRASADRASRRVSIACSSLALAHLAIYWWLVPYNTQERFLAAALGLSLVPLSTVFARSGWLQAAGVAALAWQLLGPPIGSESGASGLIPLTDNPLSLGSLSAAMFLPLTIAAAAIVMQWTRPVRVLLAGSIVVIGCLGSAWPAGRFLGEQPLLQFYPVAGFGARLFPGWEILERHAPPGGARVAYAGTNLPYYLYGIGLRNTVRYVNVNAPGEWLFHDYHDSLARAGTFQRSDDPFPQWYRAAPDIQSWTDNLRRSQIDFVFVARENRHGRLEAYPGVLPDFPVEKRWADSHPELFEDLGPFHAAPGSVPWVRVYRFIARDAGVVK